MVQKLLTLESCFNIPTALHLVNKTLDTSGKKTTAAMKDGSTEKQFKGFRIFKYSNSIGQHILHSPSGLRWHILVRGREKPCAVLPAPALQIDAR
jgi:hypothetical protein